MKLHSDPDHIDYNPVARHAVVYLNEQMVKHCVYADEEHGFVDLMVCDSNDSLVIQNGKFMINRIFGAVRVSY